VQHLVDDGAVEIAITRAHVLSAAMLPSHHADPFDRLLIAQAQIERLVLVTADPRILAYDVPALDARK
jgi:PIN domain nuclease of toxin-antitoxin system